jgi:hypothetical protein
MRHSTRRAPDISKKGHSAGTRGVMRGRGLSSILLFLGGHAIASAAPVVAGGHPLNPEEAHAVTSSASVNYTALFHMMMDNGYLDIMPSSRYQKLRAQTLDGTASEQDVDEQETPPGALEYGEHKLVADNQWLQVMRFGVKCGSSIEGYSEGFPTDCGSEYDKLDRSDLASCDVDDPPAKIGYGCWFFFSQPNLQDFVFGKDFKVKRSSGVAVNVGKSLRVDSRASAAAVLDLPCSNPPLCDQEHKAQDKLYCERAVERGYDSIQFARPHLPCLERSCLGGKGPAWISELVLCTGQCMTEELTGACPPGVELQTGAGKPCDCSDEGHVLNCGQGSLLYDRPDDGDQRCPGLTSPELGEYYVNNLADGDTDYRLSVYREMMHTTIKNILSKKGRSFRSWLKHAKQALADEKDFRTKEKAYYALRVLTKAVSKRKLEDAWNAQMVASNKAIDEAEEAAKEASAADLAPVSAKKDDDIVPAPASKGRGSALAPAPDNKGSFKGDGRAAVPVSKGGGSAPAPATKEVGSAPAPASKGGGNAPVPAPAPANKGLFKGDGSAPVAVSSHAQPR